MKIGNAPSSQPLSPEQLRTTPSINFTMTSPASGITASPIGIGSVIFTHSNTNGLRVTNIEADAEIY